MSLVFHIRGYHNTKNKSKSNKNWLTDSRIPNVNLLYRV